jgi:MraZ protein
MFLGTYRTKLDSKGRLTLPREWVHGFSQGLILTRGLDQSLLGLPVSKFESIAKGLDQIGLSSADGRRWARFLSAMAVDLLPDKKGRIPISLSQLKFAGIATDVILVGLLSYIQICDPPKHEALESQDTSDIIQIADRVDRLMRAPIA